VSLLPTWCRNRSAAVAKPPESQTAGSTDRCGKLIKPDNLNKLRQNNEASTTFSKFCDSDDRCVFVYEGDGELQANSRIPPPDKMGKKVLAFFKSEEDAGVTMEVSAAL